MAQWTISIIATCSPAIGLGHFMRCHKLATYLAGTVEYDIRFYAVGDVPRSHNCDPNLGHSSFTTIEGALKQAVKTKVDVIIIDAHNEYVSTTLAQEFKKLRAGGIKIIAIDNLQEFQEQIDLLYYPSFYVANEIKNITVCKVKYGWDCYFLEPKHRQHTSLGEKVLITTGGADIDNVGLSLLHRLGADDWPDTYFTYIKGPFAASVYKEDYANLNLSIIDSPSSIDDFIKKTDIGFTLFGVSFFEMIYQAIPTILYIPKHVKDYHISDTLKALQICSIVEDKEQVVAEIKKLTELPALRDLYRANLQKLELGNGFVTICHELSLLLEEATT
jgi:spore coat polysaccharide biosynthesis predicted glycosyltransferase SpsG